MFCFSAKLMLSLAICSVSCSMALSVLVPVLEAISLPVSHRRAAVIAVGRSAGSVAWTFTEYSERSP